MTSLPSHTDSSPKSSVAPMDGHVDGSHHSDSQPQARQDGHAVTVRSATRRSLTREKSLVSDHIAERRRHSYTHL